MKHKIVGICICMLMIGTTGGAIADWAPGDGFKMHFPQMPDPTGWDVNFHDWFLADDWRCTETGPVNEIHFWISWRHDDFAPIPFINVALYSNNPQGGYSQPLEQLWVRSFTPDQFVVKGPMVGDEGWFDPADGFYPHDHINYYQINIKNITAPFIQQNNTIYWLVIQMPLLYPLEIGWKTSLEHFMDNAVWGTPNAWIPMIDPITQLPIDLAFVINSKLPVPDLDCNGSLVWTKIKPGATVNGTFQVGNIGQPGSLLNWQVVSFPAWGTWSFSPSSGTGVAVGSWVTVTATCVAPTQRNKQFTGSIKVANTNDPTDNCTISVSLKTPFSFNYQFQPFFDRLFERFPNALPILRFILGY